MSDNPPEISKVEISHENEKIEPTCRFLRELTDEEWKNYWKYTLNYL